MATQFEYDNLPADELSYKDALPEEVFADAHAAFNEALASGLAVAHEAKVAYLYDRKGYLTADGLGGTRNAYGSDTDDVVIQLTLRVPNPNTTRGNELSFLATLEERVHEHTVNAERARLLAEIEAEDAKAAQAAEAAKKKREELEALRDQ